MSDQSTFSVSQAEGDDGVVLSISGELDLVAAPQVAESMRTHLRAGRRQILDLSEVTFIDSSGLAAIITSAQSEADRAQVTIRRSRHPQPNNLFRITAMGTLFALEPEEDLAAPSAES